RQQRGGAVEVSQEPVLLEPADVPHLPDRWLDEVLGRAEHLGGAQPVEQLELDAPGVEQRREKSLSGRPVGWTIHRLEARSGGPVYRRSPGGARPMFRRPPTGLPVTVLP